MAAPVEIGFQPALTGQLLAWVIAGSLLGCCSGLVPGLHANNFAFLLAGIAPSVPGPPLFVGCAMLAAGVVHTFLNAVPAMALGVPDAEMAVTALPGHRMVLEGRGYEAIRLSAIGSILAVLAAVPLAVPVTWAVMAVYPTVRAHLSLVLAMVVVALIASEHTWRGRFGGLLSFCLAAGLGALTLDLSADAPLEAGGTLAPLFAGLFGAPVLIDAIRGSGIPRQDGEEITMSRRFVGTTAVAGALAGAVVGYIPGISAAIAAVAVLAAVPNGASDRGYIVATSGVDTANTIFALFALVAIGQPRTGVLVAFDGTAAPLELPILLAGVVIAGLIGFVLVIVAGDAYLELIGRLTYWKLSAAVLALLCVLSFLFTGPLGIGIFAIAAAIGLVPVRLRCRRVHLMGVLIGPLMLGL
ncbi:tripartite tricarboxylate transporter permease [Natrinema longum]|uniref:Tripartite tricarboxylate transporter permease n=1 Tax=Natrinema longum TaxID=370324 RepID=A0A8A2UAI3_9EURY|nr:tripartite tricarboxylate transporter permease [Natrinema longum]MBZ6493744.1 tripartite tricarboxylate transporter permease [Natrinema longum]QSW84918.1 tripartite tricarboxylate transporter permease [Natrinema longum]